MNQFTPKQKQQLKKMLKNLQEVSVLIKERDSKSVQDMLEALQSFGIAMSEEKIVNDYADQLDAAALEKQYYQEYGTMLDRQKTVRWLNSDVFFNLIDKIIPEHFDPAETGDPWFVTGLVTDFEKRGLKTIPQTELQKVFQGLIVYSKRTDVHRLNDVCDYMDLNACAIQLARLCHDRNTAFRKMMKEFYLQYEDASPNIFPSVYKEIYGTEKK